MRMKEGSPASQAKGSPQSTSRTTQTVPQDATPLTDILAWALFTAGVVGILLAACALTWLLVVAP